MSAMLLWEASCVLDLAVFDRVFDAMGLDMIAGENDCIIFDRFVKNCSFEMMNWRIKVTMKLIKDIYTAYVNYTNW